MLTPRPRPRTDGTVAWQLPFYYYDTDGKRRQSSETFDEYSEARWWAGVLDRIGLDKALAVLDARRNSRADTMLLTTWLTRYIGRLTGVQEDGRRKYRRFITNDIVPFFGEHAPLDAVDYDSHAAWIVFLEQDKDNKPKTIRNKHGFLSAALHAAAEHRPAPLLPYNPCAGAQLPRHDPAEIDIFDNDEWELFEHLLLPRWRLQAEFGLVSMARPSEVAALLVRDVDSENGAVRINKAYKDAGSRLRLGAPKSSRGIRTVNIPHETLDRLDLDRHTDDLLFQTGAQTPVTASHFYKNAWQPALRRLTGLADRDFTLFTKKALWRGPSAEELLARFGPAIRRMSGKRLTPYTLRHTGISWKLQDGVPLFVVSRDAGHGSVTTTDRRYGHMDREASRSAAQVIAHRLPNGHAATESSTDSSPLTDRDTHRGCCSDS